jgi:hypothetical protein
MTGSLTFLDLPPEIISQIMLKIPIYMLYKLICTTNKYIYDILHCHYFINDIINLHYPLFSDVFLSENIKDKLIKLHVSLYKKISPKYLPYTMNGNVYEDSILIMPYNIIAKFFKLPQLNKANSEIIAYLRYKSLYVPYMKYFVPFEFNKNECYRISIFVHINDEILFKDYTERKLIKMPFDELFSKLIPINLSNPSEFQESRKIYAITLQIHKNKLEIYYSGLNTDIIGVKNLFNEYKQNYCSKYFC